MNASQQPLCGSKPPRPSRFPTYALAGLALAACLAGAANRELWSSREGRVAACAQGMLRSGDWLVPRLTSESDPRLEKPPLAYWLAAVSGLFLFGGEVTELAAKLPSVLAAVGTVLLVFSLGRRALESRRAGFLAALALISCGMFWDESHVAAADMPMLFCVTLALLGFWRVHFEERRGCFDRALPWLALGVGFLAKGPVALAVPLAITLPTLAVLRRWQGLLETGTMILAVGCLAAGAYLALAAHYWWVSVPAFFVVLSGILAFSLKWRSYSWLGLVVFAAVALPWYFAVAHRHPEALGTWVGESVGRADAETTSHVKPFYYYLTGPFWSALLPWVALLPAVACALFAGKRDEPRPGHAGLVLALLWTFGGLLFFTAFASKRQYYLLPLTPGYALLVGWLLDGFVEKRLGRPAEILVRIPLGIFGALLALAPLGVALAPVLVERYRPGEWPPGLSFAPFVLVCFAAAGAMIVAMSLAPAKNDWPLAEGALVAAAAALVWAGVAVLPGLNARKSPRDLCVAAGKMVPAGQKILSVRVSRFPLMAYYLGWDRVEACNKGKRLRRHMRENPRGFGVGERDDVSRWIREGWLPAEIRAETAGRRESRAVLFEWNARKKVKS